jgi:hypothetical protein
LRVLNRVGGYSGHGFTLLNARKTNKPLRGGVCVVDTESEGWQRRGRRVELAYDRPVAPAASPRPAKRGGKRRGRFVFGWEERCPFCGAELEYVFRPKERPGRRCRPCRLTWKPREQAGLLIWGLRKTARRRRADGTVQRLDFRAGDRHTPEAQRRADAKRKAARISHRPERGCGRAKDAREGGAREG